MACTGFLIRACRIMYIKAFIRGKYNRTLTQMCTRIFSWKAKDLNRLSFQFSDGYLHYIIGRIIQSTCKLHSIYTFSPAGPTHWCHLFFFFFFCLKHVMKLVRYIVISKMTTNQIATWWFQFQQKYRKAWQPFNDGDTT